MNTTREDGDLRSPKRPAHDHSPAHAVMALDAAIWTSIIEFLPTPKDVVVSVVMSPWHTQHTYDDALVSEVVATWRTLLNLRFVTKELAALLHPVDNSVLWKKLMLQFFDFSVSEQGFNVENHKEEHGLDIPDDEVDPDASSAEEEEEEESQDEETEQDADAETEATASDVEMEEEEGGEDEDEEEEKEEEEEEEDEEEEEEEDPQLEAMRGRYYSMPGEYLEEDLVKWSKLGIYHRPSQYGFLTTLQQQPPVGEWPEDEDPFTLFGVLVRLLMLPDGERMISGGESSESTFKFLAAPTEADSSSAYFGFYVMKTLGFVPHFWHWGRGIGNEWKGITEPEAFDVDIAENEYDDDDKDEDEKNDEHFHAHDEHVYLSCNVGDAKRLYYNLRHHCQDWRAVCCNNGFDGITPVFYVGESKTEPHRWIGYAGQKCWT